MMEDIEYNCVDCRHELEAPDVEWLGGEIVTCPECGTEQEFVDEYNGHGNHFFILEKPIKA